MRFSEKPCSWDNAIPIPVFSFKFSAFLVALLAGISYWNCLDGDFVFDDSEAIVNNQDVHSGSSVWNIFSNDFWGTKLAHHSSHKSYRPITILSFRLNYELGGLQPYSFHLSNFILHCIISIWSLHVFSLLLGNDAPRAALFCSILFAVHPIHTESVSGIVGRADMLCCIFVFLALVCYVKIIEKTTDLLGLNLEVTFFKKVQKFGVYYLAVLALTTIAMLCKEVGITALGLCSAYDVLVAHKGGVAKLIISSFSKRRICWDTRNCLPNRWFQELVWRHVFLVLVGLFLLCLRWLVMGSSAPKFMIVDNPASFLDSSVFRAMNYQYIYCWNFLLLFLPIWLCFDWSMGCVPPIESGSDPRLLCLPLLWAAVLGLIYRSLKSEKRTNRYILIGLALITVPFLPASNVFFRVGFVIAERILYIPVAGFCLLVVVGLRELSASGSAPKNVLLVCYSLLVLVFVFRCRQRNFDWLTEKSLFRSGLDVCPLNAKVHYNIGKVAGDEGDATEAIYRYSEAIRLNDQYDQAMNNLANILKDQGKLDEALELLLRATSIRPDFAAAWMNLGIVQSALGKRTEAEGSYWTALRHRSVYPDCLYNLGNLYLDNKEHERALQMWTNATDLKPTLTVAWTNLLILLDSRGEYEQVLEVADRALGFLPNEAVIHFNLANTLGKMNRYEASEKHFLKATSLDPSNANYWANFGVLYHRWKKMDSAVKTYRRALSLNPNMKSTSDNLSMLLKSLSKNKPD